MWHLALFSIKADIWSLFCLDQNRLCKKKKKSLCVSVALPAEQSSGLKLGVGAVRLSHLPQTSVDGDAGCHPEVVEGYV